MRKKFGAILASALQATLVLAFIVIVVNIVAKFVIMIWT